MRNSPPDSEGDEDWISGVLEKLGRTAGVSGVLDKADGGRIMGHRGLGIEGAGT